MMSVVALKQVKVEPLPEPTRVFQLHRAMDDEVRGYLLGQVLKRIRQFDEKYNPQGSPMVHTREVERDFAKDRDHLFFIGIGVKECRVVGHLLARVFEYYGKVYVHVEQMAIDKHSGIKLEQEHKIFAMLKAWQGEIGADRKITTAALGEKHIRRLRRFYGFKPMFTLVGA